MFSLSLSFTLGFLFRKKSEKNQQHVVIMYSISLYVERETLWIFLLHIIFLLFVDCFFFFLAARWLNLKKIY